MNNHKGGLRSCCFFSKYRVFKDTLCKGLGSLLCPNLSDLQNFFGNISGMYQGIGSTESTTVANQFLNGLDLVHMQGVPKVIVQRFEHVAQLSKK